jgi:hypothetical protein
VWGLELKRYGGNLERTQKYKNLLESYNVTNIVRLPTRITATSDVGITNKQYSKSETSVVEMGFVIT